MSKRKYYIIKGSKSYFEKYIEKVSLTNECVNFFHLIKESDNCRVIGQSFDNHAETLIIRNDDYNGIAEQAHDRLGSLIEELTYENANIYIHNPPVRLIRYLEEREKNKEVNLSECTQEYVIKGNGMDFSKKMKDISKLIIGQTEAITEISKSMWYLTKTNREKPYVIMLYGNSSLGKTQLVREIANRFYDNEFFEKHLSMFKNESYADYFFGEKPNRTTLGYELLERNSNLIFLDEFDKCPNYFYSAFYTLFDNKIFSDKTYEVDITGALIVLTSNYQDEEQIKKELGLPIYFRIDKFIKFNDFNLDNIYQITMNEINERKFEYDAYITPEDVYANVSHMINATGENARTIKYKVQMIIEDLLFSSIKKELKR